MFAQIKFQFYFKPFLSWGQVITKFYSWTVSICSRAKRRDPKIVEYSLRGRKNPTFPQWWNRICWRFYRYQIKSGNGLIIRSKLLRGVALTLLEFQPVSLYHSKLMSNNFSTNISLMVQNRALPSLSYDSFKDWITWSDLTFQGPSWYLPNKVFHDPILYILFFLNNICHKITA